MSGSWVPARHVAVVVPARDEESTIEACLRSVLRSLRAAAVCGSVVVVAHRCTDRTAALAAQVLAGDGATSGLVIADDSAHVGGVRRRGAQVALDLLPALTQDAWILSTDADSTVPVSWVRSILGHADHGADAVAGLVRLAGWHGMRPAGRLAYRSLVAAGIDGSTHRHAYAANLGVSVRAYREAGGWPSVAVGEEHALLEALERSGSRVLRCTDVVVTTSGRRQGRAVGGMGDLLGRLHSSGTGPDEVDEEVC